MSTIRILVCDDHEILRKGIIQLLKFRQDFQIVGEAENGIEAVEMSNTAKPDVILMDIQMPYLNGIEATTQIRQQNQAVKIIMLTISDDDQDLFQALISGANGYLLKNTNLELLVSGIKSVNGGIPAFSPGLANKILTQFSKVSAASHVKENKDTFDLSVREREVLELVAKGKTNRDIAEVLYLSEHTVKKHLSNILEKLHVKNRVEAASFAIQNGWISKE